MLKRLLVTVLLALTLLGCQALRETRDIIKWPNATLSTEELTVCEELALDPDQVADLCGRPLYTFEPAEVDTYLRFVRATIPDLRDRIAHIGRKNIGQPYEIYLLGEFPYEVYDSQPMYCLDRSDCVVFSEHTYAMSLGYDWASFFRILQRIRYMNGEVGILTRNHWTLELWDKNNDWLIEDVTTDLGDGNQWSELHQSLRRNAWFIKRFGIDPGIPDDELTHTYIPLDNVPNVLHDLQAGDFVNVIRGSEEEGWAGHTGLITVDEDGTVNFLHSTPPRVREEPLMAFVLRAQERNERYALNPPEDWTYNPTIGFKFLRLRQDALEDEFAVEMSDLVQPHPQRD